MNRREFARLLAVGGAVPFVTPELVWARGAKLPPTPALPDERFWLSVREQFVMPKELTMLNAANLCPSSGPVLETMYRMTKDMDQDPSQDNRVKLGDGRENTRKLLAEFLRVTPEEIVITRNTSESNNLVSTGIDLKPGDEVLLTADNHPSNHTAWQEKAKRFGFTVIDIPVPNPHPGFDHYVEAFKKAITPKTKVISFTHQTSTVGDLFPAKEICRLARERGILSLVDGAQTFGLMDVDLSDIQPDFYSGSAHKWPCGPKENGVLYINKSAQSKIWASIFSAYPGRVGVSRTFEGFGQRDEPAMIAFGEALKFQTQIGRAHIEKRVRELTQALMTGLRKIDGVKMWTSPEPSLALAVVSFQPGSLDTRKLSTALYQKDRIGCATRGGQDRPGLRFSPHFYNTHADIERTVAAVKKYMATGV
ncbi:MAG TPA: aminotransferase class V-fold PLP-dependent enzyme [Vicinamibacterales bacterium]|jgi:isopenicillin-N epimerase|nr:aminotransferase class V-fold PLP-dependent enzyme [Vicinamibacterales bacterium]